MKYHMTYHMKHHLKYRPIQLTTAFPQPAPARRSKLYLPDEKRRTEMRLYNHTGKQYQPFTESFSALPGLKLGTLLAAIWISWPVWGLRPVRAGRCFTEKVPKPTRET